MARRRAPLAADLGVLRTWPRRRSEPGESEMPEVMRTCPLCHTRVLPTTDLKCPACRSYDFAIGVGTVPSSGGPSSIRPAPNLYEGALLHWRLFWLIVALVGVVFLRMYIRLGNHLIDEREVDPNLVRATLGTAAVAVVIWIEVASRRLARWLGLSNWLNFYKVLKESATFFQEKGIRSHFFGPYMSAVPGRPRGLLEEDEVVEQGNGADERRPGGE
jgi:hypothetical protein